MNANDDHAHHGHGHGHCHHHDQPADPAPPTARAGTIYTCPMHPQIRRTQPGSCPICGMALEPLLPEAEPDDRELRRVRRKFWIAAALALPVVVIAMLPHLFNMHWPAGTARILRFTELLLSAVVVFWAGADYLRRGWTGAVNRSPNMYTLIGLGVLVAFSYSVVATFAPGSFPPAMRD